MVLPAILPKVAAQWLFTFYRAARKLRRHAFQLCHRNANAARPPTAASRQQQPPSSAAKTGAFFPDTDGRAVAFDMHGALLRSAALFPYFMLVAFEGGSLLRAALLLCARPLAWALGDRAGARVMAFVAFAGLTPADADLVARAVLPKHYLKQLNVLVYERWS